MRLHCRRPRARPPDRRSTLVRDLVRVLDVSSPGSFRWSETTLRSSTSSTMMLWISRTRGTRARGARPLVQRDLVGGRLDVDDDVALGQRALNRRLDGVRRRVALPDGGLRRDADHDVREVPSRRLPHPERAGSTRGPIAAIACSAASSASAGARSISTSMFRRISRKAASRTSTATRAPPRAAPEPACASSSPTSTAPTRQVAPEMDRVAPRAARRPRAPSGSR